MCVWGGGGAVQVRSVLAPALVTALLLLLLVAVVVVVVGGGVVLGLSSENH